MLPIDSLNHLLVTDGNAFPTEYNIRFPRKSFTEKFPLKMGYDCALYCRNASAIRVKRVSSGNCASHSINVLLSSVNFGVGIGAAFQKQLYRIEVPVPASTIQNRMPAIICDIDICAMRDQQMYDFRIAIACRVMNRLITAPIYRRRQMGMSVEQRLHPCYIREKKRPLKTAATNHQSDEHGDPEHRIE